MAISNLETDHAGNYSCVATNSVAEYVRSAVLTIRGEFNKSYQKTLMNDQISGKYEMWYTVGWEIGSIISRGKSSLNHMISQINIIAI